ncbi:hypothetical protein DPMN_126638 [Dreissena polymorpha]|uniref:Uncharacterized protein n=1 Tax=Dreissena polymorpha TaxID=45954 RepID=A0A9D4GXF2_DREPO|nr:hypothetical protein DPMN_126638 [Dreissena polymorpha]
MGSLWCIMAFLIKGFSMTGAILVRQHGAQIVATFECTSHTDITINFIDLSNTPRIIADCDAQVGSCHVYDSIIAKYYAVTYTDEGAFVYIKNTTYALGKYTCCETYNKTNCDSTELVSFAANDPNRSYVQIGNKQSEIIETDQSGRSDCMQGQSFDESLRMMKGFIISSFISILIFILILIGIFFRRLYLKGHLQRIKRTKRSPL